MKIALIEPPAVRARDMIVGMACEAPLALTILAATLIQRGHEVIIIDAFGDGYYCREKMEDDTVYVGLKFEEILRRVADFKAEAIGISATFYFNLPVVVELADFFKDNYPEAYVILGGNAPTTLYERLMRGRGVDFIVLREADHSLPNLLDNIKDPSKVPGVVWRNGPDIRVNTEEPFPADLDALPFPARSLLNLDTYVEIGRPFGLAEEMKRYATILTSRGCPFSCSFCSATTVHGKRFRYRSSENVLAEIDELVNRLGVTELHFIDENFTLNRRRVMKIMDGLIDRGYNKFLSWTCPNGVFVESLDGEMIDKMQESNCHSVALAVESGDPEVLKKFVQKKVDHKHIERIVRYFKEHTDILLYGFFIIGFPGETKEQICRTFKFANKLQLDHVAISMLMPYPFTEVYDRAVKEGSLILTDASYHKLIPNQGVIKTREFSPSWLKAIQETDRFLALHRKKVKSLWTLSQELVSRNGWMAPRVAAMTLYHAFKGDIGF
jgi:magnesium-protoporphyrin IX monomethyl ester (oxidative) cyclase